MVIIFGGIGGRGDFTRKNPKNRRRNGGKIAEKSTDQEKGNEMNEILKTAQWWKLRGIATIPIRYASKQPAVKWLTYTERLPEDAELLRWFGGEPMNIGIVAGWEDLVIIDFDDLDVFRKWQKWAYKTGGVAKLVMERTRMHTTSRGIHVFVRCCNAENLNTAENFKLPKIDVLARNKYALLPPSKHPSGANYEVWHGGGPWTISSLYEVMPKQILDLAYAAKAPKSDASARNLTGPGAGTVNSTIPGTSPVNFDPDAMWDVMDSDPQNQQTVARIKERFHVEDFFPGAQESGGGRWLLTCCPFHDDHNPSFWIDTKNQICGCHSGCTPLPLDVIGLYARLHNVDNRQAIKEMAAHL